MNNSQRHPLWAGRALHVPGPLDVPAMNADQYKQYLRLKEKQTELLRTVPPALKPYYKQKVSEYFNTL